MKNQALQTTVSSDNETTAIYTRSQEFKTKEEALAMVDFLQRQNELLTVQNAQMLDDIRQQAFEIDYLREQQDAERDTGL